MLSKILTGYTHTSIIYLHISIITTSSSFKFAKYSLICLIIFIYSYLGIYFNILSSQVLIKNNITIEFVLYKSSINKINLSLVSLLSLSNTKCKFYMTVSNYYRDGLNFYWNIFIPVINYYIYKWTLQLNI